MDGAVEGEADLAGTVSHGLGLGFEASGYGGNFLGVAMADVFVAWGAWAGNDDALGTGGEVTDLAVRDAEGGGNGLGGEPHVAGAIEPPSKASDIRLVGRWRGLE